MRSDAKRVLIVGGSTRAAAWSAVRAGFQPVCADLFADLDTHRIAEVIPVRDYPDSIPDDVANVRAAGWFYTGALENRPDLIKRLERPDAPYGPLWGTSSVALARIRDPFWLAETLRQAGLPGLRVIPHMPLPPADGTWMRKPLSSAGGRAVCVWNDRALPRELDEPVYFQERCFGTPLSALYHRFAGAMTFLGMTRQLIGYESSKAFEPFAYCGSIGPLTYSQGLQADERLPQRLTAAVERLAAASGLQGLFGVDFIQDETGNPRILEVNPRYTASVEVLELASQKSMLFASNIHPDILVSPRVVAKMILYARLPFLATEFDQLREAATPWEVPEIADVPVPGTRIEATWPICTVLSSGATEEECLMSLYSRVDTAWKMVNHRAS